MAEPYLAPHPWDSIGKPPEPGKPYVEPEPEADAPKASASPDGFTDSKGRHIDFETGVREAARCILDRHDRSTIEDMVRFHLSLDEILEWLVYPESGEFPDDVLR